MIDHSVTPVQVLLVVKGLHERETGLAGQRGDTGQYGAAGEKGVARFKGRKGNNGKIEPLQG